MNQAVKKSRSPSLKRYTFSHINFIIFMLIFAAIGGYVVYNSLAAPNSNLPGDLNNDNVVSQADITILAVNLNTNYAGADINQDNIVNFLDLSIILSNFGKTANVTWTFCANENGQCTFSGTKQVRYGANGQYVYQTFTGGTACNNSVFGDPAVGYAKECDYADTGTGAICVLNDGTACPASYFNGPLGTNNLIPSKPGQFLLDQYGGGGCYWQTCGKAGILKRQADIGGGRHFDGIGMQKNYGYRADNCTLRAAGNPDQADMEQWIHDNGSFPIIRWNPDGTIGDVNNGLYDSCFTNLANYWKNFNFTIMLSPFTEFDGHAGSWQAPASTANGNVNYCGGPFIAAWQRMVNKIHPIAPNVGFVWEPQEGETRSCIDISYPGDTYVDWTSTDWYNFCTWLNSSSCYSTPLHAGWSEWWELFNYSSSAEPNRVTTGTSQHDAWGPHKPFYIIETETIGDPTDTGTPSHKGNWFRNVTAHAKKMKYLRGIMWFDADVTSDEGASHNFKVDYPTTNPDIYNGYLEMSRDPWFNAK